MCCWDWRSCLRSRLPLSESKGAARRRRLSWWTWGRSLQTRFLIQPQFLLLQRPQCLPRLNPLLRLPCRLGRRLLLCHRPQQPFRLRFLRPPRLRWQRRRPRRRLPPRSPHLCFRRLHPFRRQSHRLHHPCSHLLLFLQSRRPLQRDRPCRRPSPFLRIPLPIAQPNRLTPQATPAIQPVRMMALMMVLM